MLAIALYFWQLCLLRRSPGELPASPFVLGFALAVSLALETLLQMTIFSGAAGLASKLIDTGANLFVQGLVTWALLYYKQRHGSFLATWTALLGAQTVILLATVPFYLILLQDWDLDFIHTFANSARWVCLIWLMVAIGYIYHKAADVDMALGTVIAMMSFILSISLAISLDPGDG